MGRILWFMAVAAAAGLALVGLLWVFQRGLIYLPARGPVPGASNVFPDGEDVSFATDDGLRLHGWFLPAPAPGATTVLVFNGNAGDRSYRAGLGATLRDAGAAVLLLDYRGYGDNPGSPSERGLMADARAARDYLLSRSDVDAGRLVYFGESLGSGVAVGLAAEHEPAGLILRSPFPSLVAAARVHYPFLPVGSLMKDRYPSIDRIGNIRCPVLVIAGAGDTIVPARLSRALYDAAAQPKRLVVVPGANHNDPGLTDGSLWYGALAEFLEDLPSAGQATRP